MMHWYYFFYLKLYNQIFNLNFLKIGSLAFFYIFTFLKLHLISSISPEFNYFFLVTFVLAFLETNFSMQVFM